MFKDDPFTWVDRVQGVVQSKAVWDCFGEVIGLGDRHMGNIMLKDAAQIVMIDYECVFQKGKQLPVPELIL